MTYEIWKQTLMGLQSQPHYLPSLMFRTTIETAIEGFTEWRERNQGYDFLTKRDVVHIVGHPDLDIIERLREIVDPAQVTTQTP